MSMEINSGHNFVGSINYKTELDDAKQRIKTLEDENELLMEENDKYLDWLKENDDENETDFTNKRLCDTVSLTGQELKRLANNLENAKNRTDINLIVEAIRDLSKNLLES
jgi:hypothetical protein